MKKFLFLLIGLFYTTFAFADKYDATKSCRIEGTTNDYVEATVYVTTTVQGNISGYVIISNSSSKPLMSYKIVVTAEKSTKYHTGEEYTPITLHSATHHKKCDPYSEATIEFTCNQKTYGGHLKNLNLSITNPVCK